MAVPVAAVRFVVRDAQAPTGPPGSSTTNLGNTGTSATQTATPAPTPDTPASNHDPPSSNASTFLGVGIAVGVIIVLTIIFYTLRLLRKTYSNPKYIPTPFFKKLWIQWRLPKPSSTRDASGLESLTSRDGLQPPSSFAAATAAHMAANTPANRAANAAIDRNTSIRSVMTLPAYNPKPGESEQVLGREGERDGIDTIVEYPENEIAAERQRDEEMEALYQVRLARRTEAAEREERRRLRAEARDRGDTAALRELRGNQRVSSIGNGGLEAARAIHEAVRNRERAVSSVSYGDLGVARHDGTRIRANSEESERPLLGDAASMASTRRASGLSGIQTLHTRNRSQSSVLSIDTQNSDAISPGLQTGRSRADSTSENNRHHNEGNMSSPEIIYPDNEGFPDNEPPEYIDVALNANSPMDAPPEYFSPIDARPPPLATAPVPSPLTQSSETSPRTSERSGASMSRTTNSNGSSRRGVGGAPQLPSLRLANLPSIQVTHDTPTIDDRGRDRISVVREE